jgi:hypothetical protein
MKKLFKRAIHKITIENIPYNLKFRPTDILQRYGQEGIFYQEIYPPGRSTLDIDPDLYNSCTEYIKTPKVVDVPPSYVVEITNGRIYSTRTYIAIIDGENKLVPEVSYQFVSINKFASPGDNKVFKNKFFLTPEKYRGAMFSMLAGGGAISNYGHWLIDVIPRIGLLKKSGLFDAVDWFLVPNYKYDFHIDTLALLGIKSEKIIVAKEITHVQADRVIASTSPRYISHFPAWVSEFLRDSYLNIFLPEKFPPNVYVRRSDSSIRNIINEDELVSALNTYGFVDYELSSLKFLDKVNLFRSAEIVVSATGAGLANLNFCNKAKILEIFNSNFISTIFADIASKVGLDYSFLIMDSQQKVRSLKEAEYGHFTVDVDKVVRKIQSMLASKTPEEIAINRST